MHLLSLLLLPPLLGLCVLITGSKWLYQVGSFVWAILAFETFFIPIESFFLPYSGHLGLNIDLALSESSRLFLGLMAIFNVFNAFFVEMPFKRFEKFLELLISFGVVGVLFSQNFMFFFFCWELILIPLLILAHQHRYCDKNKNFLHRFLIYTQVSSFIMLLSYFYLVIKNQELTGIMTLDFSEIKNSKDLFSQKDKLIYTGGFIAALGVKLALIPFHGWLKDMYRSLPLSALSLGLLIKTSVVALITFVSPFWVMDLEWWNLHFVLLGAICVIYASMLAYSRKCLASLSAYASIAHMGFFGIAIGGFGMTHGSTVFIDGLVLMCVASGLSTYALMFVHERLKEKHGGLVDLTTLGGYIKYDGLFSFAFLGVLLAGIGFPLFLNFVGEFMILSELIKVSPWLTALAALGGLFQVMYGLKLAEEIVFSDSLKEKVKFKKAHSLALFLLFLLLLGLGMKSSLYKDSYKIISTLKVASDEL